VTRFLASILAFLLLPTGLTAEERIALVVGNGNYAAVTSLDNPVSDAVLLAERLRTLDFEVTLLTDTTQVTFKRAVAQFGRSLREAGPDATGLFYYAGHGVQSFGANYLLPVDARLTDAADLDLVALEASSVLRQMASARNKTNIVVLDACRNNPFAAIADMNDNGLAEMKAPTGTYLAYATAPGGVALDGLSGNSPFTQALAEEILVPGAPIEQVFKQVRVKVIKETAGTQTPWDTSSLVSEFSFRAAANERDISEQEFWATVKATRDPVQIMLYLRAYPDSPNEAEARRMLAQAVADEAAPAPAKPIEQASRSTTDTEVGLYDAARKSGSLRDFQAYLDAFPDGVFAELAKIEMAAIAAEKPPEPPKVATKPAPESTQDASADLNGVSFDQPLAVGDPPIVGKTIEEVVKLTPLFPPIEGIPEELWKGQTCSNCHNWTREALCTQAKTYLALNAQRALGKEHPFGGSFKRNLKAWGAGGCR